MLRVAVIGAGPAGIYASDLLIKTGEDVTIDLYERMPAPFGLIRYGVAPDHPRIKGIITSLHNVMNKPQIRLLANINIGTDITIDELRDYYHAIIFATGATGDRPLTIPGGEHSHGAGEFVGFYDGNPNFQRTWNLQAEQVAIIGVGNVALDIARILAKTADELHTTEIPDNVYHTLATNQAKEIHIFGRRGPAQAKFSPLELKELDHSDTIEVIVNPEDIDYDDASITTRHTSKSQDLVCQTLETYAMREPKGAPHKLFIHFFETPTEIHHTNGHITAITTERTQLDGTGNTQPTGKHTTWNVQAVYHAVGYQSDPIPNIPFDHTNHIIPNDGAHITDTNNTPIPGLYATGWIKRGPVGLIGNTKSDAKETTTTLINDWHNGHLTNPTNTNIIDLLNTKHIDYATWQGWQQLDQAEQTLGQTEGRERKKIVEWNDMLNHTRAK